MVMTRIPTREAGDGHPGGTGEATAMLLLAD